MLSPWGRKESDTTERTPTSAGDRGENSQVAENLDLPSVLVGTSATGWVPRDHGIPYIGGREQEAPGSPLGLWLQPLNPPGPLETLGPPAARGVGGGRPCRLAREVRSEPWGPGCCPGRIHCEVPAVPGARLGCGEEAQTRGRREGRKEGRLARRRPASQQGCSPGDRRPPADSGLSQTCSDNACVLTCVGLSGLHGQRRRLCFLTFSILGFQCGPFLSS